MRNSHPLLVFLVCVCCLFQVEAQNVRVVKYGVTHGLGRADVSCIYQDSRGVLWVGTSGAGIYQFVQGRFSQQTTPPETTGYRIEQIEEDSEGYLYMLSEIGLMRFDGRDVLKISASEISSFTINHAGVWWTANDSLYLRNTSGKILRQHHGSDLLLPDLDSKKQILSIAGNEMTVFNENLKIIETNAIPNQDKKWKSYSYDGKKTLWIASTEGGLIRRNPYSQLVIQTGLTDVRDIAAGALGSLWIADGTGISVFQTQDSTSISISVGSPVNCIYFDRYNRLWIGSATEGLIRYFGEQHRVWDVGDEVLSVLPAKGSAETVLHTRAGLELRIDDSRSGSRIVDSSSTTELEVAVHIPFFPSPDIQQVYRDARHRTWVLTPDKLFMLNDSVWTVMDSMRIVTSSMIKGSDTLGNIWIASENKLLRYAFRPVTFPIGVKFEATQIAGRFSEDETISILRYQDTDVLRIGSRSIGVIENDQYKGTHFLGFTVLSTDIDAEGVLWLGSMASGIYRIKPEAGQSPKPLLTTYPLRVLDILFLKNTNNGLIAGTERNILRLQVDTSGIRVTKVDVLNANAGIEFSALRQQHFGVTEDGHLLVASQNQVVEFDLFHLDGTEDNLTVHVGQLLINGKDYRDTRYRTALGPFLRQHRIPEFAFSENNITIVFAGNTVDEEYVYYQWRLNGQEWTERSPVNEVQLSGLAPGSYILEARICDTSGNCAEIEEPFRFIIRKALWQHVWFWVILGLGIIAACVWIFRARSNRNRQQADQEKRRLEAELNALTLEQKSLQLQMNPHFIFNALQTVRSRIHEDKLEDARLHLTQFAKLMRVMLEMSRTDKITLEEELEFLTAYADVEKMSHHLPVTVKIGVDEKIEPYEIEIPPMIIQPILENAIKYGGDGSTINVDVQISKRDHLLIVTIEDNGAGFGTNTSAHKSASLDIIKNRLMHLGRGGGLEIGKGKDGGASVELKIPLKV